MALCFQNVWHCASKMYGTVLSKRMALCFQNVWYCAFKMALCFQNVWYGAFKMALCFQNDTVLSKWHCALKAYGTVLGTVLSKWHCAFKMALCFQNGTMLSKWHCAFKMALCFQNGTVLFKWHCAFKMALCNQNNCGWSKTWACGVCAAVLAASRNKYGHICRVGQNRICTSRV